MKRPTWWQRAAAFRNNPMVVIMPFGGIGLTMVACSLAKYGFSNAIVRGQLLFGLCFGLVYNLFLKWLYRRYQQYYVDQALGLRPPDIGIGVLQVVAMVFFVMPVVVTGHGIGRWIGFGALLFTSVLRYPEVKAIHERIKAKLAQMEDTP